MIAISNLLNWITCSIMLVLITLLTFEWYPKKDVRKDQNHKNCLGKAYNYCAPPHTTLMHFKVCWSFLFEQRHLTCCFNFLLFIFVLAQMKRQRERLWKTHYVHIHIHGIDIDLELYNYNPRIHLLIYIAL